MTTPTSTPNPSTLLDLAAERNALEYQILQEAEGNEGELDSQLSSFLESIDEGLKTKVDHYRSLLQHLKSKVAEHEENADQFTRAAKTLTRVIQGMEERIKQAILLSGGNEIRGKLWKFKISETSGRLVLDEHFEKVLPQEYLLIQTVQKPDHERIKADLKAGKEIPGATIVPGVRLTQSINK